MEVQKTIHIGPTFSRECICYKMIRVLVTHFHYLRSVRHFSVVMSLIMAMHPGMGLMGARSTPTIREDMGMCSLATCIHDPGAAHRSMQTRDFWRNSNFLFSWTNLKEARERYPISLADQYALSRRDFPNFDFLPILSCHFDYAH